MLNWGGNEGGNNLAWNKVFLAIKKKVQNPPLNLSPYESFPTLQNKNVPPSKAI